LPLVDRKKEKKRKLLIGGREKEGPLPGETRGKKKTYHSGDRKQEDVPPWIPPDEKKLVNVSWEVSKREKENQKRGVHVRQVKEGVVPRTRRGKSVFRQKRKSVPKKEGGLPSIGRGAPVPKKKIKDFPSQKKKKGETNLGGRRLFLAEKTRLPAGRRGLIQLKRNRREKKKKRERVANVPDAGKKKGSVGCFPEKERITSGTAREKTAGSQKKKEKNLQPLTDVQKKKEKGLFQKKTSPASTEEHQIKEKKGVFSWPKKGKRST